MKESKFLSKRALITLNRMGDLMIPANGEFPGFSDTGCIEHIDEVVAYAPKEDISDLNMLLVVLSYAPGFVLKWLLRKMETSQEASGPLAPLFRQLDFGMRGIIFTSYYSGKTGANYTGLNPHEVIDYSINRITD